MAGYDWGSAAGAAVSLGSAYVSSKGAKDAGKGAGKAGAAANELTWRMYQDTVSRNQPFYSAGIQAQDQYLSMLGLKPSTGAGAYSPAGSGQSGAPSKWFGNDRGAPAVNQQLYDADPRYKQAWDSVSDNHQQNFGRGYSKDSDRNKLQAHMQQLYSASAPQNTQAPAGTGQQAAFDTFRSAPGYQFGLDEGNRSVEASAAARGGLNSGATLKALTKFGQGYADQQGYTPYMNRLSGLFGGAQTAAGQMGSYGQSAASQIGGNLQNTAQARANSTYASNQAMQQGAGDAYGFFNRWYQGRQGGGG